MNAWYNIDIATSVNMIAGTDSRRDSWINEDPQPPEAVRLLDEMKAQIGVSTATQVCNEFHAIVCRCLLFSKPEVYDLGSIGNLYCESEDDSVRLRNSWTPVTNLALHQVLPNDQYDIQVQLQDIDRIFVKFLPYSS